MIFDTALNGKTCSPLVSCCVTKTMSTSKILSYIFFIWLLVPCTRAGLRKLPKSFKEIPISSSGSAAVTERKFTSHARGFSKWVRSLPNCVRRWRWANWHRMANLAGGVGREAEGAGEARGSGAQVQALVEEDRGGGRPPAHGEATARSS